MAADLANVTRVKVVHAQGYGNYLADGEGRALYVFSADRPATAKHPARSACSDRCQASWPPALTKHTPHAGRGVHRGMLSTTKREDGRQVTYHGWPLYYFKVDWHEGERKGQARNSFGGTWYLISPSGRWISAEKREMNRRGHE